MKAVYSAAAFAAAASAAVLPRDQCCFEIYASGGVSGLLGQLSDGQNRINGSYAPEKYCYSNGGIIDAHGRGCIVTIGNDATHQFQCDEGKPPTLGFSIANNGSILYQGNDQFYACPYEYEYNVYTQWLKDQKKCRPVKLSMHGSCSADTTGGYAAPSGTAPGYSIPAYGGSTGASVPGYGQQTPPAGGYSSYGTALVPTGYGSQSVPSYGSSSQPVVPGYGGSSPATSQATVPASTAPGYGSSASSIETPPVQSTPAVPGYGGSSSQATIPSYGSASASVPAESSASQPIVPGYGGSASSIETSPVQSTVSQPSAPGYGSSAPAPSSAPVASSSEATIPGYGGETSSAVQSVSIPAVSSPVESQPSTETVHTTQINTVPCSSCEGQTSLVTQTMPAASSAPEESSPVQSTPAVPSYIPGSSSVVTEQPSSPAPTASAPEETTITMLTTVLTSDCEETETQVSSGTTFASVYTTQSTFTVPVTSTGVPSSAASAPSTGSPSQGVPSQSTPAPSDNASTTAAVSTPAASSAQSSVPPTSASGSACQTSLTGSYQTPHLIVPIASAYPDTPQGNSVNASINSDCSTIMNFDIPESYAGKTCSVIFLFPEEKDLETSAYTFSGSGDLVFSQCSGNANEQTTYNNAPKTNGTLDTIGIEPGNSYVVATAPCAAGTTQSYELSSENGLSLEFFEDWNPSSLGLYITAC